MSCTPLAHAFDSPSLPVPDEQWCRCGMTTWGQMHRIKFEEDAAYLRGLEEGAKIADLYRLPIYPARGGMITAADAIRQRIAEVKGEP